MKKYNLHDTQSICSAFVKTFLTTFTLFIGVGLYAQETVPASGGEATGTGGSSTYTAGQVIYTTNIGSNGSTVQGVQQSYEIFIVNGIELTDINLELTIYPNPTTDELTLSIANYNNKNLNYQLSDMSGKVIETKKISDSKTKIHLQALHTGTYLLHILNQSSKIKTFKIVKK